MVTLTMPSVRELVPIGEPPAHRPPLGVECLQGVQRLAGGVGLECNVGNVVSRLGSRGDLRGAADRSQRALVVAVELSRQIIKPVAAAARNAGPRPLEGGIDR